MVGQGTIFFVRRRRLTKKNSGDFIDFKLIQENKITDRAEMIRSKLEGLENLIDYSKRKCSNRSNCKNN